MANSIVRVLVPAVVPTAKLVQAPLHALLVFLKINCRLTILVWLALLESGQMGPQLPVQHVLITAILVRAPVNAVFVFQISN